MRFMAAHPSRAYLPLVIGPGRVVMEVGVAEARFSEHLLVHSRPSRMYLIEPRATPQYRARLSTDGALSWRARGIGNATELVTLDGLSLDAHVLQAIPLGSVDLVYLDGAHDYENVKREMAPYWERLAPGGILAGHDYCNYGESPPLGCHGCAGVPRCGKYTELGVQRGKKPGSVHTQAGVVRAVQEWLSEEQPRLRLHHTSENFTRDSLSQDGMDYDLVLTMTRNPSWWIHKPRRQRMPKHV